MVTHKPKIQVSKDLPSNSLKVGTSFDWVNECMQQPVKQQVRGSRRRMKEEELLKGTNLGDMSELILLSLLQLSEAHISSIFLTKKIEMLVTQKAITSVLNARVNTGVNSIYGHNSHLLLVQVTLKENAVKF